MVELLSIGLKYLDTNNNIYAIDRMYNTPPLNIRNSNCSGLDTQCIIGLISAKLAHNDQYEQICNYYSNVIKSADVLDDTRCKFEYIKDYIKSF